MQIRKTWGWMGLVYLAIVGDSLGAAELTWDQYVQLAQEQNPALQAAKAQEVQALARRRGAYQNWWPQISAGAGYQKNKAKIKNYQLSLNASYPLFQGGATMAAIKQASANFEQAALNYQLQAANLSYALKAAVANWRYGQNYLSLAQDIEKRRQRNLDLINLRFKSGRENKGSYLLSQAYLEQAKYEVLTARDGQRKAQTTLAQVVGKGEDERLTVAGELPAVELPAEIDLAQLTAQHPAYRQAQLSFAVADAGVTSARSTFFPTISLTGSLGRNGDKWVPKNEDWTIGANLTWPLFRGGADYYQVKAAVAERHHAKWEQKSTWQSLYETLQNAYQTFKQARQKVKVFQAFVDAGLVRANIARTKYNNGMMTFDEWDKIESDLITNQKNLLQSQRDLSLAAAAWEKALGTGVIP